MFYKSDGLIGVLSLSVLITSSLSTPLRSEHFSYHRNVISGHFDGLLCDRFSTT